MNTRRLQSLLACAFCALAATIPAYSENPTETKTRAEKIILHKAAFKNDTLEQAVAKLQKYADEAAPAGESVKIKLDASLEIPIVWQEISMVLYESPLSACAKYLANGFGCRAVISQDTITIVSQ